MHGSVQDLGGKPLFGRNLTDSYYMLNTVGCSGSSNPNQYVGFFNRPRAVVLQGTVRF